MAVYCRGEAEIVHASDGQTYKVFAGELDWDQVDGSDRNMGAELHYEATVEHPELGTLTWSLWEYPEGVENDRDTDVGPHQIVSDLDYGLEHEE